VKVIPKFVNGYKSPGNYMMFTLLQTELPGILISSWENQGSCRTRTLRHWLKQ